MSTPGACGLTVSGGSGFENLSDPSIIHVPRDFRIPQPEEDGKRGVKIGVHDVPILSVKAITSTFARKGSRHGIGLRRIGTVDDHDFNASQRCNLLQNVLHYPLDPSGQSSIGFSSEALRLDEAREILHHNDAGAVHQLVRGLAEEVSRQHAKAPPHVVELLSPQIVLANSAGFFNLALFLIALGKISELVARSSDSRDGVAVLTNELPEPLPQKFVRRRRKGFGKPLVDAHGLFAVRPRTLFFKSVVNLDLIVFNDDPQIPSGNLDALPVRRRHQRDGAARISVEAKRYGEKAVRMTDLELVRTNHELPFALSLAVLELLSHPAVQNRHL